MVQSLRTIPSGRTGLTYNQSMQPNGGIGARGLLWNFVLTGISETGFNMMLFQITLVACPIFNEPTIKKHKETIIHEDRDDRDVI